MGAALLLALGQALQPGPQDVYARVVDVGPGLCTITAAPGGHYKVYDAGHWVGDQCLLAAREVIEGETIDLLILSHSDASVQNLETEPAVGAPQVAYRQAGAPC